MTPRLRIVVMILGALALVMWAILKGCPAVVDSLWGGGR
jgi:hypothetical protein